MKIVKIRVVDENIHGAGVSLGAVGSHNSTIIEAQFSEVWMGKGKLVMWTNAVGEQATITPILPSMLVEGTEDTYRFEVPAEATAHAGMASISIKGTIVDTDSGVETVAITTEDTFFRVLYSVGGISESDDVSASNTERILTEIEVLAKVARDNVTKFNALENKPFTYIENVNLDELLATGEYYAFDKSTNTFNFICVRNADDEVVQMIWSPISLTQRYKAGADSEWVIMTHPYVINGFVPLSYNDLMNIPFVYLSHVDLNELEHTRGRYVVDEYEFGGQVVSGPAMIVVSPWINGDYSQTIYTQTGTYERKYDHELDEWSELGFEFGKYTIIPLEPNTEGVYKLAAADDDAYRYCSATISEDCSFAFYPVEKKIYNHNYGALHSEHSICIYANITADVSIDWGTDVIFYNGEIPEIGIGLYEIIFTFDPNAEKWCVGALLKGAAA